MQIAGKDFIVTYLRIIQRCEKPTENKNVNCSGKGGKRYVSLKPVLNHGTLFGLQSGGGNEPVLISMPPVTRWKYYRQAEYGNSGTVFYED